MNSKNPKIFVTGISGMLGSHLAAILLQNHEIYALKRPSSSLTVLQNTINRYFPENAESKLQNIHWVEGDILDYFCLRDAFEENMIVYHCAAFVSFHKKDADQIMNINVEGTKNILAAAQEKKISKLCYVSSIAALGRGDGDKVTTEEDYRSNPVGSSVYSNSKFQAEMEVWRAIAEGLNAVIVNPSVILGAGEWSKGSSELFRTVAQGLKFYTRGINGYVDVEDVAKSMVLLAEGAYTGERYILNAENWTYEKLFNTIAQHLSVSAPLFYARPWMGSIAWRLLKILSLISGKKPIITKETAHSSKSSYRYSSEKFIRSTQFKFKSLDQSIREIAEVYKSEERMP